ncbi:MAG: U32 family peptidase, partial [Erysipelotrichaceae bacterium]|nr:U32 family peptidase [Erysipelotrichaceae bacterium]
KEIKKEYEYAGLSEEDHEDRMIETDDVLLYDGESFPKNYVINTDSAYPEGDKALICEFGGILKGYQKKIAYYTLNCNNSYSYEFLKRCGFKQIILSTELHENEINDLIRAYEERNGIKIRPYVFKEGNRILMYIRTNPLDRYMDENKKYYLSDGTNDYLIRHNHGLTELIETDKNHSRIDNVFEAVK